MVCNFFQSFLVSVLNLAKTFSVCTSNKSIRYFLIKQVHKKTKVFFAKRK